MSQATANRGRRGCPKSIRPSSFRWMVGIVLIPFVILGILAGMGIRAQKAAARAGVREEAESLATAQARLLSDQLKSSILPIPSFPDPPLPSPLSPKETILNGEDLLALATLRDDPKAGNSPAGLPRRALAGLRILHLDPTTQDPSELVTLLTDKAPSILSSRGLEQVRKHFPKTTVPLPWQHLSRLRELLAIHPNGGWIAEDGEIWWISENGERFLPPTALTALNLELAPYATAQFSTPNGTLGQPLDGDLLARVPLDFPSLITLEWILTSPELIEDSTRQQTLWTVALLGTSLIASALGFFALLRAFSRERRLGQMKSQFVASVSHELRAPIGSIRLMADTLEEERTDDPKALHQLIARESTRLSHLIENVLDFARIEEGRRTYHFEECNLASLVHDTLDLFSHRATETGHLLKTKLPDCRASVDPSALQQALINLLDNALKFSPPGSAIAIALDRTAKGWSIAVTSEGDPIPAAEHARIFDRFYRLGDELRRETQGTGIGLSIVQHIMHAHGGKVIVACDDSDHNTFAVQAPLTPPDHS